MKIMSNMIYAQKSAFWVEFNKVHIGGTNHKRDRRTQQMGGESVSCLENIEQWSLPPPTFRNFILYGDVRQELKIGLQARVQDL